MKKKDKTKSAEKGNEGNGFRSQHDNNTKSVTEQRIKEEGNVGYKKLTTLKKDNYENSDVQYVESIDQPTKKKKKRHKNKSKKLQENDLLNQHCLNLATATDQIVSEIKRKPKLTDMLHSDESLLLQLEPSEQSIKKKKKRHKNKSSKNIHEDNEFPNQHCSNSETLIYDLVPEIKRKNKYINVFSTDERDALQFESTEQPIKNRKRSHKNKSKELQEDISNQHFLILEAATNQIVSETKGKHKLSNTVDNDESPPLQFESIEQPAKKKKKAHKNKSSKKLEEDIPNQHSETANIQIISETVGKRKLFSIVDNDESPCLQFESIEQPTKKKKAHKNKSSKKLQEGEANANQLCLYLETPTGQIISETEEKHKVSCKVDNDERPLLQFDSVDQPVKKKKKAHKNKSSKKLEEDEDIPNQHSETATNQIVSETVGKRKLFSTVDNDESPCLQFESIEQPAKKKKAHKNKSSKKLQEGEDNPNQLCLYSKTANDQIVSETEEKHKLSCTVGDHETPLLKFGSIEQTAKKKKKSHKNKSSKKIQADQDVSNQHWETATGQIVSETKGKHKPSTVVDNNESPLLQFDSIEQPAKKEKKANKGKYSKKLPEDDISNQLSETATDQIVSETEEKYKLSSTVDKDESPLLQFDFIQQPSKKKKKAHKKSSKTIQEDEDVPNQFKETANVQIVSETKGKHTPSTVVDNNENPLLQFDFIEQPAKKKKKAHKNKSSKKLEEDEDIPSQHSETATNQIVSETVGKRKPFSPVDDNESQLLQFESMEQAVTKKKKAHNNISSKKFDEDIPNQHCSNSEAVLDEIVSDNNKNQNCSLVLDTDQNLLLQHEQSSEVATGSTLHHNKKVTHKSKSTCKRLFDNDKHQAADKHELNSKVDACSHSSKRIHKNVNYAECEISEDEVSFDRSSSMHFTVPALDLTEEPVEFNVPLLHSSESVRMLDKVDKKCFESNGVIIKTGRFSPAEDAILKRNYENFTKRFGVDDPILLLGLGLKRRNEEVAKFLKAKHFYVRLGEGLSNRSLRNIYIRARLLLDPRGKEKFGDEEVGMERVISKLDDKEVTYLKQVHDSVGNKWSEIGNLMDKNDNTVRSAFLWYDELVKTGKWTSEERNNLIKAIKVVTSTTDISKLKSDIIPWIKVAELVPTRNWMQCRSYWLEDLSWTLKGKEWNKSYYPKLISILAEECCVENYADVDWKLVQKCFYDSTGISASWVFLRKKWYALKKVVPLDYRNNYKQILNFLCLKYNVDT